MIIGWSVTGLDVRLPELWLYVLAASKAGRSTPEWGGLSRVLLVRNMPVISLQVSCGHQTAPTSKWPWLPAWRQPGYDVTRFWAG